MQIHLRLALFFLATAAMLPSSPVWAGTMRQPQDSLIWFAPESHYPSATGSDFLDIFNHPHAWRRVAGKVQVLQLSTQFFIAAPDEVISKAVRMMKRFRIALAVAAEAACGPTPGTPDLARTVVQKIEAAGGAIDYIAMDEPFWHVHASPLASACHLPLEGAAARTAEIINVYLNAFPQVRLGDVEPFPVVSGAVGWQQEYTAWLQAFRKYTGRPITFLHMDFDWREPRLTRGSLDVSDPEAIGALARAIAGFARSRDISIGMIANGKANAKTDLEWAQEARANIDIVNQAHVALNHISFESWHRHPEKLLPEEDPSSFTGLILSYIMSRSSR